MCTSVGTIFKRRDMNMIHRNCFNSTSKICFVNARPYIRILLQIIYLGGSPVLYTV